MSLERGLNYYERHIGDYLKDTSHLTLLEHGVYSRLLDVYYTRECAIPDGDAARLVGARSKEEKAALRAVLQEFFTQEEHGDWIQPRCEQEIERYLDKSRKAKAAIAVRWEREKNRRNTSVSGEVKNAGNTDVSQTNAERSTPRARSQSHTPIPDTRPIPRSKASGKPERPIDVSETVWNDWVAHRKAKKATVTDTVIDGAREEAAKARMTLEAFLRVWCTRGTQGLQADWLTPAERMNGQSTEQRDADAMRLLGINPETLNA